MYKRRLKTLRNYNTYLHFLVTIHSMYTLVDLIYNIKRFTCRLKDRKIRKIQITRSFIYLAIYD